MHGMMCHSRPDQRERGHEVQQSAAPRPAGERVADADRSRVAALLGRAFRDGVLRVEEFDERLSDAYRSQTVGDLDAVTADLPDEWMAVLQAEEAAKHRAARRAAARRAEVRSYLGLMALLIGIWTVTSLTAGQTIHFWPLWPALGWGIPLFLGRSRSRPSGWPAPWSTGSR